MSSGPGYEVLNVSADNAKLIAEVVLRMVRNSITTTRTTERGQMFAGEWVEATPIIAAIDAALSAQVPRVTPAMLAAGRDKSGALTGIFDDKLEAIFIAMYDAALAEPGKVKDVPPVVQPEGATNGKE